jgi:hypothetical protein
MDDIRSYEKLESEKQVLSEMVAYVFALFADEGSLGSQELQLYEFHNSHYYTPDNDENPCNTNAE